MVEGKVCTMDVRGRTNRAKRESSTRNAANRVDLVMKETRVEQREREREREGEKRERQGEREAKIVGLEVE